MLYKPQACGRRSPPGSFDPIAVLTEEAGSIPLHLPSLDQACDLLCQRKGSRRNGAPVPNLSYRSLLHFFLFSYASPPAVRRYRLACGWMERHVEQSQAAPANSQLTPNTHGAHLRPEGPPRLNCQITTLSCVTEFGTVHCSIIVATEN